MSSVWIPAILIFNDVLEQGDILFIAVRQAAERELGIEFQRLDAPLDPSFKGERA